ncbi:MAG: 50S ribosomal protein L29 [Patescibacteria group bacterium]
MKIQEQLKKFRAMNDSELASELKKIKKELALASLKVKVGKLDDISQVNKIKKNIARINSVTVEKLYGAENE